MTWTKLSDDWNSHPKMLKLNSRDARLFWVDCLTYCNSHHTDGEFPSEAVRQIGGELSKKSSEICLQKLVEVGLLDRKKDGSGYIIHDFLAYNPSRSELDEKRETTRKRVESFRRKAPCNAVTPEECNAVTSTHVTLPCNAAPVPSRPVPSRTSSEEILRAPLELAEVPAKEKTPAQLVTECYFAEYKRVRGKAPPFGSRDGKAVKELLASMADNPDRVCAAIRKAFLDPFWADKATICAINADPGRFDGGLFGTLPAQARSKNAYPVQGGNGGASYLESLRKKREANDLLPDEPVLECADV